MTEEKCSYLFVYGTLMDESNPYGAYLKENSSLLAEGKFKGELYDIGNYPGAILNPDAAGFVHGSIFTLDDPAPVLSELGSHHCRNFQRPCKLLGISLQSPYQTFATHSIREVHLKEIVNEIRIISEIPVQTFKIGEIKPKSVKLSVATLERR